VTTNIRDAYCMNRGSNESDESQMDLLTAPRCSPSAMATNQRRAVTPAPIRIRRVRAAPDTLRMWWHRESREGAS
jgi:hypothetical protein